MTIEYTSTIKFLPARMLHNFIIRLDEKNRKKIEKRVEKGLTFSTDAV